MTLTGTWVNNPAGTALRRWITALIVAGIAGAGLVAAAPAAVAASPPCLVVDATSDQSYTSMVDAVNAAAPGDTLFVKGVCAGFTLITKDLTITGQANGGTKTATLDNSASNAPVLAVFDSGATVTLNNLVITGGHGRFGGGMANNGTLTLNNTTVIGNTLYGGPAPRGAGIFNSGTLTLNDSTFTGNTGTDGYGGGISNNWGTVTLNDSTVSGNTATSVGGGIYNRGGAVTLNASAVTGNTSGVSGGGIYNLGGKVTLGEGSTVTGNTDTGYHATNGGGINNTCGGILSGAVAGTGGNVYNNTPDDIFNDPSTAGC